MPTLLGARRTLLSPGYRTYPLTITGGVITDATRRLADQGDGLAPSDQSDGVWAAATNRYINSNAKTNTTSIVDVGATTTREALGLVGADTTRFKTVTNGGASAQGTSQLISGGAGSTQYTISKFISGSGTIKLYIYDTIGGKQLGSQITLTTTPTKYSLTATTGALGITVTGGWETDSDQAITVYSARWMCQTGAVATPHVLTDGGTAASTAGRIQVPNIRQYLSETQGWVATYLRPAYNSASLPNAAPRIFQWRNSGSADFIHMLMQGGDIIQITNDVLGGDAAQSANASYAYASGVPFVAMGAWTTGAVKAAANGGTWSSTARTEIPVITETYADLGGGGFVGSRELNGDILTTALGRGQLTDADSAAINAIMRAKRGALRPRDLPGGCSGVIIGSSGVVIGR